MEPKRDISKRLAIIGLLVILALAAWMRFDGLGRFSFWTDEMYHVIAAQSFIEGGEPLIPVRGMYWRSFIATGMTIMSFSIFGESEWSARLPFALVSLVFLGVAYRVLASRFTRTLSLLTVMFLALTPQFLQVGRECRMYAPFVLLYFIGVFIAYRIVELRHDDLRSKPIRTACMFISAAIVFSLAMSLQYLAMNVGFTLATYCLIMAVYTATQNNIGATIRSRYSMLIGLMCLCLVLGTMMLPGMATKFLDLARTTKDWDTRGRPAPFCLWFFNHYYPVLWYLYPLGAVILIRRHGRMGLFIVCAFLPVLLTHMYLMTSRIAERYLVYILPFFFLTSACVIETLLWGAVDWLRGLRQARGRLAVAAATVCVIPALWLFLHPWFTNSSQLRRYGLGPDWKHIAPDLQAACKTGIVITTWPREVQYYGGRFPDYVATQTYEYNGEPNHVVSIGNTEIAVNYVLDEASLSQVLTSGQDVYFVTTDWAFVNNAFLDESMREVILRDMQEVVSVNMGEDRAVIFKIQQDP